jgi:hypothetical protein
MDVFSIIEIALTVIGAASVLFRAIVAITPSKKDDAVLSVVLKALEYISLNKSDHSITIKKK